MRETWVQSLGQEDSLKKEMATHSSILAWRIPWAEEPGGLQFMGSQRVGHDRATNTHSQTLSSEFSEGMYFWFLTSFYFLTELLGNLEALYSTEWVSLASGPRHIVQHSSLSLKVLDIVPWTWLLSLFSHSQEGKWNRPHWLYVMVSYQAFQEEHMELSEWKYWDILKGWRGCKVRMQMLKSSAE